MSGCAEGYYAVGMARLAPEITVYAYDIEERARIACADLAQRNGVADRVIVGGEFAPDGFEGLRRAALRCCAGRRRGRAEDRCPAGQSSARREAAWR